MSDEGIQFIDMKPKEADFRKEVIEGLSRVPKKIPPKFFYDAKGSILFEKITDTSEYYVTKSEEEILRDNGRSISEEVGEGRYVIEYGSGNSRKSGMLISSLKGPAAFAMIDISHDALSRSAESLSSMFPELRIFSICADYLRMGDIPTVKGSRGKLIVFLGSTIGNFEPQNACKFLDMCYHDMEEGDAMLVGVDLKKDREVLNSAYNDSENYTAMFNTNLLERIRRELNSDIDPARFRHVAFYNEDAGRIEMHLESLEDQDFTVDGRSFHMKKGETIHTENSYKYSRDDFTKLAESAGLKTGRVWSDSRNYFGLFYLYK